MLILYILFVVLLVASVKIENKEKPELVLKKETTCSINGLFLLFVFCRHVFQYIENPCKTIYNNVAILIDNSILQLLVVPFLFFSGYGVMESILKKGDNYVNSMPKKRIFVTWANYAIAVIIYMLFFCLIGQKDAISLSKLHLYFLSLGSFGFSYWYILCILYMYISTYIAYKLSGGGRNLIIIVFLSAILYSIYVIIKRPESIYFADTCFAYVFGLLFSYKKELIYSVICKHKSIITGVSLVLFAFLYTLDNNLMTHNLLSIVFCVLIILLLSKVTIQSKVLLFFGNNLFPIYIYQRIPMILLSTLLGVQFASCNPAIYISSCFALTIVITFLYKFIRIK